VSSKTSFFSVAGIVLAAACLYWLLWGNIGLRLADEGFLWSNSICTLHGDIPMRDMQSYDPGRYYWNAFWMQWFGQGILGVRLAALVFQSMALACVVLVLRRVTKSWGLLLLMVLVVAAWMNPLHKVYDHSLSIMSVYVAVLLLEQPTIKRYFFTGLFISLAAIIGRNHGLYNVLIFTMLGIYIHFKISKNAASRKIIALLGGITTGYLPMLIMLAVIPGFFDAAIVYSIHWLENLHATNITLPVPWPWAIDYRGLLPVFRMCAFLIGGLFILLPLYYACVAVNLSCRESTFEKNDYKTVVVASFFVGTVYLHYAFSRADLGHLALGIHPFLLGMMALSINRNRMRWQTCAATAVLVISTVLTVGVNSPRYIQYISPSSYQLRQVQGDRLWVDRETLDIIDAVTTIHGRLGPGETMLFAPRWPGLYAVLGQRSPIWETFFLVKQLPEKEKQMVTQLKHSQTPLIILGDVPLDQRDDLRFRNTHPILYRYISDHYEPISEPSLPVAYQLWQRKS